MLGFTGSRTAALTESDVTGLVPALAAKAPLADPILTGNPRGPTPSPGDNDTSLATSAFVQAAIAALVASSPAALDTLNELAAALGNDASFATTVTNALALKAALAGAGFTGKVTITKAAADTVMEATNTDAGGYGIYVQAAANGKYMLLLTDRAGASKFWFDAGGALLMGAGNDVVIDSNRLLYQRSYTVVGLPSAASFPAGVTVYVSNEVGGGVLAFSDGTNWRRVTDRAVVS